MAGKGPWTATSASRDSLAGWGVLLPEASPIIAGQISARLSGECSHAHLFVVATHQATYRYMRKRNFILS
jgi:hypothetical protein